MAKYGHRPLNWFEAIVNKLGGETAAERFLRGELVVTEAQRRWCEEDGAIVFPVISFGNTGRQWRRALGDTGYLVNGYARQLLVSKEFVPTDGVKYDVVVLRGTLWNDEDRVSRRVRAEAAKRGLATPSAEVACLIRAYFTDEEIREMGFARILVMHRPFMIPGPGPSLLGVSQLGVGRWLEGVWDGPDYKWDMETTGFAFIKAQTAP